MDDEAWDSQLARFLTVAGEVLDNLPSSLRDAQASDATSTVAVLSIRTAVAATGALREATRKRKCNTEHVAAGLTKLQRTELGAIDLPGATGVILFGWLLA